MAQHHQSAHRFVRNTNSSKSGVRRRSRTTAAIVALAGTLLVGGAQLGAATASAAPAAQTTGFVHSVGSSSAVVQPVSGTLTSSYGPRGGSHHDGIDIGASIGTPIYSAASGSVISAGAASGFGQWVRVQHNDGTITVYGHVDTYLVSVGQRVAAGQQIATVGNRGQSSGPHLHFEVWDPSGRQVDPQAWLRSNGVSPTW
ncbi:M23 family metallopeptidase [Prescottella defluvii]|uniref:M23 family metallopeptidase n=1 Tax=Prescottella defluvii TaxID=1323361 RepID=UPI0004F3BB73|nr:M23 family metallopeptidase [Prescottella defluvii]